MSSTLDPTDRQTTVACVHCGLPTAIPAVEFDPATAGPVFCCPGCRGAYQLIHGWGLEAFYDLRERTPDDTPVSESDQHFDDLDDPALLERSAPRAVAPEGVQPMLL